ncbi:alpha/beta hydrolase [Kitasatospora sp. RB6PN24]|uniref:alpha/beta hydrolase n=1 Tax=Kitasatospora humi TaxID=2893891 RepID=UPI001E4F4FB4|nr:alpha/beta hydrolase [Kitasatospora humi]MCC9307090.1 alpha/beta hydrolase [Kitasatospora humi]
MTDDLSMVSPRQDADGGRAYEGLTYAEVRGFRPLLLDLRLPPGPGPAPVAVWVHGGGFQWGDRRYPLEAMEPEAFWRAATRAGLAVATIDYRLSGEARFPAQLDDAQAALAFLRRNAGQLGLDPGRIGLWGESAGGAIAALAAFADGGVRAVATWYAVTDMAVRNPREADSSEGRLLGGRPVDLPELAGRASPVAQVPADPPPFLLLHGTADTIAAPAHSELLHQALLAAGGRSELVLVPGAQHAFDGWPDVPGLVDRTVAFLAEELAG